ncbi:hypothetical protein ABIA32_002672 [Streptacidiphilus sp. MAP12-20]|uniref:hypothetical protein n=1 Tax=Streptacidiphilus sp. MAP12-20 TaxID=3156299 RepID=UPI003517CB99
MRISPNVLLIAVAAAAVFGVVAYGSANSSHSSPAPINTPSLSRDALKAIDAQVWQWDRTGGQDLITLISQVQKTGKDMASKGTTRDVLSADCAAISSDATQVQHDAPIPDGPAEAHLTRALQDILPGASQCGPGSNQGVEAMGSATYMINQGILELEALNTRLEDLDASR